jgi:hypothetical protein
MGKRRWGVGGNELNKEPDERKAELTKGKRKGAQNSRWKQNYRLRLNADLEIYVFTALNWQKIVAF